MLSSILDRHIDELLARLPAAPDFAQRVRHAVAETLRRGEVPAAAGIAARLHMSPRTLQRRLQADEGSFQSVLDEVRRDLAIRHLQEGRLSLSEVAFLLGFAEASAFHRAFKRWTGETPLSFRARAAAVSG